MQLERDPERSGEAVRDQRSAARYGVVHDRRDGGARDGRHRVADRARARRRGRRAGTVEGVRAPPPLLEVHSLPRAGVIGSRTGHPGTQVTGRACSATCSSARSARSSRSSRRSRFIGSRRGRRDGATRPAVRPYEAHASARGRGHVVGFCASFAYRVTAHQFREMFDSSSEPLGLLVRRSANAAPSLSAPSTTSVTSSPPAKIAGQVLSGSILLVVRRHDALLPRVRSPATTTSSSPRTWRRS